jgi:hypothetical protein
LRTKAEKKGSEEQRGTQRKAETEKRKGRQTHGNKLDFRSSGLPDFSWYKIPKRGKNKPNYYELYQMSIKYNKRP